MASTLPTPTPTTSLPAEEQEALKAAVFQRLHPRVYFERFLGEKVRPDGRDFDAWRSVSVHVGECDKPHSVFRFLPFCNTFPNITTNAHVYLSSLVRVLISNHQGSISTANGSALVRLGDTTVVCGVKAEIAEPELDTPEEGFLGKLRSFAFWLSPPTKLPEL